MSALTVLLFALLCAYPAFSQILINEVLFDPEGTDTGQEKIEIRNVGSTVIDLTGYDLYPDGIGYFTFPSVTLAPGAIAVVHLRQSGTPSGTDFYHSAPSSNIGNSSGSVALFNSSTHSSGTLVSFVQWGAGGRAWASAAVSAGIWTSSSDSVPAVIEGHSIEYDGLGFSSADWFDQAVPTLGAQNSLPVQLIGFSAHRNGATVVLSWETLSEVDNFGFDVERRMILLIDADSRRFESDNDGVQWAKIGFLPGSGTTHSLRRYSFVDNSPLAERSCYRLRQMDRSGAFSFSDIVEVEPESRSESIILKCYPNPFNPTVAVSYWLLAAGDVDLRVHDVLGREVAVLVNGRQDAGKYTVFWDASLMPTGTYVAVAELQGKKTSQKMLLVK